MEDLLDALLFPGDRSPEERSAIQAKLDEDPALAEAWAGWCDVCRRLRRRLRENVSDRRLLVLYVLEQEGAEDALTSQEREVLADARADLRQAIDSIPALQTVVEQIRAEFEEFEAIWEDHVDKSDAEFGGSVGSDQASPRERSPDRTDRAPRSPGSTTSRRWARRLVAAGLVVTVAVLAVLFWPQGSASTTITVAEGQTEVTELADGSTVRLVGPATLSYAPGEETAGARRVDLETGRAFFDVRHRTDASFVVETPTARTTVLGTQFSVVAQTDTTEVVLASGSVRLESRQENRESGIVLEPGQRSWVARAEAPASPSPVDLTSTLEWTGLFVFRSAPLRIIADRLMERYDTEVSVADPIADATITGTFERDQPADEVLNALAATLGAEVETTGDRQYRIVPRK